MIRLFLLGPQRLLQDEHSLNVVLAQPKRFGLLAFLAVGGWQTPRRRDQLLGLFWPELDEQHARRALTYALYFLRRELGDGVITKLRTDDLAIDPSCLWCDVSAFEQAMDDGRLEDGLALYRGDFLEGFFIGGSPELEQWLDVCRLRFRERARSAAWSLIESAARSGAHADRARWARRALELASDDERALRELLTALHASGDLAGAIAEFELFARRYEEVHDEPVSEQTRSLIERLRATPGPSPVIALVAPSATTLPALSTPSAPNAESVSADQPAAPQAQRVIARARSTWSRTTRRLALAGVTMLLALVTMAIVLRRDNAADGSYAKEGSVLVAVLPFAYHGAPELHYSSDGFTTLLSAGIDRAGGMRTVSSRALLDAVPNPESVTPSEAARTARRFNATSFVLGDITAVGQRLRISAMLYDAAARASAPAVEVEGAVDSLFELVDLLSTRLAVNRARRTLGATSAAAREATRSLPALRAFVEGERQFRSGHHEAAILAYKEALGADSAFALAYLRMSQAANWTGDPRLQHVADERVQALRDRLPERESRRAAAWHELTDGSPRRAAEMYRELVTEDPTDVEAWYYFADVVFHQGTNIGMRAADSRASWEHVLALTPDDASAYIHLARLLAASGDRVAFDSAAHGLSQLHPSEDLSFEIRALRTFAFEANGDQSAIAQAPELAAMRTAVGVDLAEHLTAAAADPAGLDAVWATVGHDVHVAGPRGQILLYRAGVAAAGGEFTRADRLLDSAALFDPPGALRSRAYLATLPFLPPRADAMASVRAALARGDTIARTVNATSTRDFFSGVLALRANRDADAAQIAAQLERATNDSRNVTAAQFAPLLRAELATRAGRTAEAIDALGATPRNMLWGANPSSALGSAYERWLKAEAFARAGRERDALRVLASFPDATGADIVYAAAARLREAELLEHLGERDEAIRRYRRARQSWTHADGVVAPLIARADAGLTRLRAR